MKTSTRRLIGAVVLGVSIVSALVLSWFGVWQGKVLESHTHNAGPVVVTTSVYEAGWPFWLPIVLLGVAGLGLVLLVIPWRGKTNA